MPYLGMRPDGEQVTPLDVNEQDTVLCPLCEGELGIRDAHFNRGRFVSRHFFHKASTDCGGESTLHSKLKTIAALKLRQIFTQATVTDETQIGDRVADVVATFEEPLAPFGKGLIVEVQHKHDDKEIGPITGEYLREGYSVYWAYQSDFEDHDMTFAEHRARTVWPDAVPLVEGLDGYPECVQLLIDPEPPEAVELTVPIPHEYWRAHAFEVASPSQSRQDDELQTPGWEALETVWLHGKGREIAWVNILRAPSAHVFLEFWTKDRQTDETAFLPARADAGTVEAFEAFLEEARTAFSEEAVPRSDDHEEWVAVASVEFAGTQACESWLSIAKPPQGRLKVIVGRRDRWGNTRTLAVNYREGDLSRLAQVRATLAGVFDVAPSSAP